MHTSESDLAVWSTVHTEEFLKNSNIFGEIAKEFENTLAWLSAAQMGSNYEKQYCTKFCPAVTFCYCMLCYTNLNNYRPAVSTVLIGSAACTSKPASDYRSAVLQTWMPKNQQCCRPAWLKIDSAALFLTNPKCQRPFFATEKYWT